MFEALELGRSVSKKEFNQEVAELRTQLLQAQESIRELGIPVIIIISGVEGSGKSEVVNRLNEWLDSRGLRNHALWEETDEERMRPYHWRFWRVMPPKGSMALMFGSWYTRPIIRRAMGEWNDQQLDSEMRLVEELENMLCDDGALIIKFWYHLGKDEQKKRIKDKDNSHRLGVFAKKYSAKYEEFARAAARTIRLTDGGQAPWHLVEATDRRYRDLKSGKILFMRLRDAIAASQAKQKSDPSLKANSRTSSPISGKTILDSVDVEQSISKEEYREKLKKYQERLHRLSWAAYNAKRSVVSLFEGWDASGKGGNIRRLTAAIDARLYSVISVAAPTDEEKSHHYLWRFWRHLPMDGYFTFYDRSWYGRVLVERVEGFAGIGEWNRAYREINDFEEHLVRHGIILNKFWIHISPEEQLRRFKEREQTAWKQYKITDEDWRNRQKWNDYAQAITDLVEKTSTVRKPWTIVAGNDKRFARIEVIKTLCQSLENALGKSKDKA